MGRISDDWKVNPYAQTSAFWTGKTILRYGNQKTSVHALASKKRSGPHRDQTEAKNEAKAKRFISLQEFEVSKCEPMSKSVNIVRYDMSQFLTSCVESYCTLAEVDMSSLAKASTPFTDAGIPRPTLDEEEKPGRLQGIASKVLMKILFAARMARYDLLRAIQSLASRVTRWSTECDIALHRLVCYINTSKHLYLEGFVGDPFEECVSFGYLPIRILQGSTTPKAHQVARWCWSGRIPITR